MAATLDATVGGEAANSYVDIDQATALIAERETAAAWESADPDARTRALISATRRLDVEGYRGARASSAQALQWPRAQCPDPDATWVGDVYPSDVIPARIERAQVETAYQILAGKLSADDTGLEGFASVKVGALEVVPNHQRKAGMLPESVRREIRPLLVGGENTVRLMRG